MAKLLTLRNIITLLALILFASCSLMKSPSDELQSISSEDNYTSVVPIGVISDRESGKTIYVVSKK